MSYSSNVKDYLLGLIHDISCHHNNYVVNPAKNFIRNRKLGLESTIKVILSLSNQSSEDELLDFFNHQVDTPSLSALIQQRDKISSSLFPTLLERFNSNYVGDKKYKGYRLLACDGTDLNIFHNPNDSSTYYRNPGSECGFNELHIDGLYDIYNRMFLQLNIDGRHDQNEPKALVDFVNKHPCEDKSIFIADRNYETWNAIANTVHNNQFFLIRAKDVNSNGILKGFHLTDIPDEFDMQLSTKLYRLKRSVDKSCPQDYHYISGSVTFDFLPPKSEGYYDISFRALRFKINDNRYECIITNLSKDDFSLDEIKNLYSLRWGIETSYRELKYALSLNKLHSKKVNHIIQEIFAKVIMYNFCSIITMHVAETKEKIKHTYQINFSRAIKECKKFFLNNVNPPDVESVIKRYMLPIRSGRSNPRKVKIREKGTFLYR